MKHLEKRQARELRRQGFSVREICRKLAVAKSSVSLWVRDIELTTEQISALEERMFRSRERFGYLSRCGGANTNHANAESRHRAAEQAGYEQARRDEKFRLVSVLYWGEGSKRNKNLFAVANSDPKLLRIIAQWLIGSGFGDKMAFQVQYYAENGLSEEDIRAWWNANIPVLKDHHWRQFVLCKLNRASQRKKVGSLPYGTATVRVSNTNLFFQVMGGIKYLKEMGDW